MFLTHTLRYQVTFANSWGDSYIIRVTSAIITSKRGKSAFRKFTSSSVHGGCQEVMFPHIGKTFGFPWTLSLNPQLWWPLGISKAWVTSVFIEIKEFFNISQTSFIIFPFSFLIQYITGLLGDKNFLKTGCVTTIHRRFQILYCWRLCWLPRPGMSLASSWSFQLCKKKVQYQLRVPCQRYEMKLARHFANKSSDVT